MNGREIEIRKPDDMHVHLRQGEPLKNYLKESSRYFKKLLVMPNTIPPVSDVESLREYRKTIENAAPEIECLMTFKILPDTSAYMAEALIEEGVTAAKLYPEGVTTNSDDSVGDVKNIYPVLEIMQSRGTVLSVHAEAPGSFSMRRESDYLATLEEISRQFPKLRIVIEHVSQKETVEYIKNKKENFAATITAHHMLLTLDDIIGEKLNPHNFCKPVAKTPADRTAVRSAAFSGDPRFFFGSDSAPHPREAKESGSGLAGIYSAPAAVPLLAQLFTGAGCGDKLEAFVSQFGSEFYGLKLNSEKIKLKQETWRVPELINGVVPFLAGSEVQWKLA